MTKFPTVKLRFGIIKIVFDSLILTQYTLLMLESMHAITGAVIAYKLGSPLISLPIALLSHFLLDLLPHWNPSLTKEKKQKGRLGTKTKLLIYADCFWGLILGLWVAAKTLPDWPKLLVVLAGCLAAILPDLVEAPYFFFGRQNKFISKLMEFQNRHQWKASMVPGILFQVIYLGALFWLLGK